MIIKRSKLFAKTSTGEDEMYFRDSRFWRNFPGREQEEDRILKLLKDLDKSNYLNQHGKDYLSTVNHRDEIHISSYMLTDEGEDIMERYGSFLENGTKNSISLGQINQIKKRPMNFKERREWEEKKWKKEQEKRDRELKKESISREDQQNMVIRDFPEVKKIQDILKKLEKEAQYQKWNYIDDIDLPKIEDISWATDNKNSFVENRYVGVVSVGGLWIYYDTKDRKLVEEIGQNGKTMRTKPVVDLKKRLIDYFKQNKSQLLNNAYNAENLIAHEEGSKELSQRDKKSISDFVDREIKMLQSL